MLDTIEIGDCRDILKRWASEGVQVQTCVTSPPYFGLRDYGTASWDGGSADCDHVEIVNTDTTRRDERNKVRDDSAGVYATPSAWPGGGRQAKIHGHTCPKCGAKRIDKQIGLEPTLDEYVAEMVQVFRLVRDVLRDDATVWLNLGDSYSSDGGRQSGSGDTDRGQISGSHQTVAGTSPTHLCSGLKAKNLLGIPWRVAFALQADGWYLRQDIIWHKPNPMPESVTDRCTKAHEYIFLLSKRDRYYYDAEAIREPASGTNRALFRGGGVYAHQTGRVMHNSSAVKSRDAGMVQESSDNRNKRSVWTVPTQKFSQAHFATFPEKLIEPCILAGCPVGGIVLDPFMGSGTTAAVAMKHGRHYLGCDLNPEYAVFQDKRIEGERTLWHVMDSA